MDVFLQKPIPFIGIIIFLIGYIWLVYEAEGKWALLLVLFWPLVFIYADRNREKIRQPITVMSVGLVISVLGAILGIIFQ